MNLEHHLIGQVLFLKLLSLSYFTAFYSLFTQVLGLYGSRGIAPIQDLLFRVGQSLSEKKFFYFPTLFWYRSDDSFLRLCLAGGAVLSLLIFFGIAPPFFILILWALYLSFVTVGAPFLNFQWDILLLEAGVAGFFLSLSSPPPVFIIYWIWFLAFRLLFASGLVKLQSRCPSWASGSAMCCHFETQPLPNWGGFLASGLFAGASRILTVLVFFFELFVPLGFLGTDSIRASAAVLSILFQLAILATGNFAFFNLLTIALLMTLIDDRFFPFKATTSPEPSLFEPVLNAVGAAMLLLNILALVRQIRPVPYLQRYWRFIDPFCLVNHYGLFAWMTTQRNEIILEGSNDEKEWKPYQFRYKPQELNCAPKQIAPLHPRLDWQLWFEALSSQPRDAWWQSFITRLLQGSPEVLALLDENPFPERPPRFIRAHLYRYRFNSLKEWWKSGNYWNRTYVATFMKPTTLT